MGVNILSDFNPHTECENPPFKNWKGIDSYQSNDCTVAVFVNEKEQEVIYRFPTLMGICTMKVSQLNNKLYQYQWKIGELTSDNGFDNKFQKTKPLHQIGMNNRNELYRELLTEFKRNNLHLPGEPKEKVEQFLVSFASDFIYSTSGKLDSLYNEWLKLNEELNIPSFFEEIKSVDHFTPEQLEKARLVLTNHNVIEVIYDVIELIAVAQKPKAILELLIALSSVFPKPLHSLSSANPGKSKSTIGETVFKLFPKHRRMRFGKTSTVAGLLNMIKYKEGTQILKHILIRVGDFGDKKEQEQAMEIISLLKELMSEGEYTKILTDMTDDFGRAMILRLEGCGSVHMEIISPTAESQYMSRALLWSPDDNKYVQKNIMCYQEDELERVEKESEFHNRRLFIASIIESIFQFTEGLTGEGASFEILNPYTSHLNALLRVKDSPNANRDRMMVQMIPKMVTLTNCLKRDVYYNEKLNAYALIVNHQDYVYTIKMLGKTLSHFIHKKPEVLGTYTTIIEERLFGMGGVIRTLNYNDLKFLVGLGRNAESRYKIGMDDDTAEKDSKREMLEMIEIFRDAAYFTYNDIAKYTTVTSNTVRDHMQELEEMELVVIDKNYKPHRVYVPSDYHGKKKVAFSGIFDYDMILKQELDGELELRSNSNSMPISLLEDNLNSMYNSFLERAKSKGWLKVSNSNTPELRDDLGALEDV